MGGKAQMLCYMPVSLLPEFRGNWQKRDKGFVEAECFPHLKNASLSSTVIPTHTHHEARKECVQKLGVGWGGVPVTGRGWYLILCLVIRQESSSHPGKCRVIQQIHCLRQESSQRRAL